MSGLALLLSAPTGLFAEERAPEPVPSGTPIQVTQRDGRLVFKNVEPTLEPVVLTQTLPAAATAPSAPVGDGSMPTKIQELVRKIADLHGVDPHLVAAVMKVESNYDQWARSKKGALGLMQLIPATGERFGVQNFFDAEQNIEGGVRYLKFLSDKFPGNLNLILAAYNAGENLVDRIKQVPQIRETQDYVRKIKTIYTPTSTPQTNTKPAAAVPATKPATEAAAAPGGEPTHAIYQTVDERGVRHFSNVGP